MNVEQWIVLFVGMLIATIVGFETGKRKVYPYHKQVIKLQAYLDRAIYLLAKSETLLGVEMAEDEEVDVAVKRLVLSGNISYFLKILGDIYELPK